MRASIWIVLAVFGCGREHGMTPPGGLPDAGGAACKIENVLATKLGTAMVQDCGRLQPTDSTAAFRAARDCAIMAANAQSPFVVLWDIQGIDSRVAAAFVGLDEGAFTIDRLAYDGDPGGGGGEGRPVTSTSKCASLTSLGDCSSLQQTLCLTCNGATPAGTCSST